MRFLKNPFCFLSVLLRSSWTPGASPSHPLKAPGSGQAMIEAAVVTALVVVVILVALVLMHRSFLGFREFVSRWDSFPVAP